MKIAIKGDSKKGIAFFLLTLFLAAVIVTERWSMLGLAGLSAAIYLALDALYLHRKTKRWIFPWNGFISALIIACVLSPSAPLAVWILAPVVAVACKRLIRPGHRPLFNPAAFSLAVLSLFFPHIIGWWVGVHWLLVAYLILSAVFTWTRLKKWRIVAAFAVAYYATLVLLYGPVIIVAPWMDPTVLFFAGVMLIEPMTSAFRRPWADLFFGAVVGLSAVLYGLIPGFPVDLFLAALLTGNFLATIVQNRVK